MATEVTAPALLETLYELGRVALLPLGEAELAAAALRAGTLALSTATPRVWRRRCRCWPATTSGRTICGEHSAALGAVDADAIAAVAAEFAPTELAAVLLGDASVITEPVETIRPLTTGH